MFYELNGDTITHSSYTPHLLQLVAVAGGILWGYFRRLVLTFRASILLTPCPLPLGTVDILLRLSSRETCTLFEVFLACFLFTVLLACFSEKVTSYSRHLEKKHDMLLGMLFDHGTYKKLYSYRHLINGFAVHISPEQVTIQNIMSIFNGKLCSQLLVSVSSITIYIFLHWLIY